MVACGIPRDAAACHLLRRTSMKTSVTKTSIDAYHNLDTGRQQQTVLATIRHLERSCIADIAAHLGWEKSTVAARLNELKQLGVVRFVGKEKSKTTGITSEFWRTNDSPKDLF